MSRSATPLDRQMNLPFLDTIPTGACDQPNELTLALVELFLNAAQENHQNREDGDGNE
jgi:hypothetical protein